MSLSRLLQLVALTGTRRSRNRHHAPASVGLVEQLEQKQLLTVGLDFDFTVIASDLSPDLRLFGSTDPADAPFEVIRYGSGVVTGLEGFESERLLATPGDLTFEVGSMNVNSPVEVMTLDRATFDDGLTDGTARQNYTPVAAQISFFYQGRLFGRASFLELSLEITPQGVTTGIGRLGTVLQATSPESSDHFQLRRLINRTFSTNEAGDASRAREFSLGAFQFDGAWAGVGDAEVFQSSASMRSSDDFADQDDFATPWDRTSPWTGQWNHSFDRDFVKMNLDPTQEYEFRIDSDGSGGVVDFTSDFPDPLAIVNFDGRVLNASGSTWVTVRPQSGLTNMVLSPQENASYTVTFLRSAPASFNIYFTDDFQIAWTPERDANGDLLPVEGYRLEFRHSDGVFLTDDVGSDTLAYSLEGILGITDQQLRIGRLVNGEVASWSDDEYFRGVDRRPTLNGFDGRTFTWDAIPGVPFYELYLGSPEYRVQVTGTSYELPDNHPIGWRQAWIRGARTSTSFGGWSRPLHYHARSPVSSFTIDQTQITQPQLQWTAVPGADNYEIYISRVGGGVIANPTGLTGTEWTLPTPAGVGRYRVWMRAQSAAGINGRWSAMQTFDVATLPVSTSGTSAEVTFTWENPPGVDSVDLYISNGSTVIRRDNLTGTSWTETHDFQAGWLNWWVRGGDNEGNHTPWSDRQRVRVGSTEFSFHPTGTYNSSFRPFFRWEPVLGASSYEVYFRSFTEREVLYEQGLTDTQFRGDTLPGNRYFVWVNTVFPDGSNRWSRSFTFDIDTQSTRIIVTPNGAVNTNTPTIEWSGASSRTRLWVRNETAGTNEQIFTADSSSTYTFTEPLAPGRYRIWAARWNSTNWGNSVLIIVADNEPAEADEHETLLAHSLLSNSLPDNMVGPDAVSHAVATRVSHEPWPIARVAHRSAGPDRQAGEIATASEPGEPGGLDLESTLIDRVLAETMVAWALD
ncbi:MAG: hypothetical protein NXI04_00530 [Planctomycetaceae bacterium]|nr:hypothetical protein [Planctomycetaceae bacterium]